jgi:dihydroorotase
VKADFLIHGGRLIDPAAGLDGMYDTAVKNDRIISVSEADEARDTIDASGCLVTPGLIDYHTHIFRSGAFSGTSPEMMAAQGTTAAVDAGTAGTANYDAFHRTDIENAGMRIRSFLLPFAAGQVSFAVPESYDPRGFDTEKIQRLAHDYPQEILGLKIKFSRGIIPDDHDTALRYLKNVVELADTVPGWRVCVHVTDAPLPAEEIASLLRAGDIYCHCYAGEGNTILDAEGRVFPGIRRARERGVLFDAANGFSNFSIDVAQKAIAQGFLPDIISTDLTSMHANRPGYVKNLPYVMSKYLALGLNLKDIIKAVTAVPAEAMNLAGQVGTLAPGSEADVAIFRLKDADVTFRDKAGSTLHGTQLLVPQLTILQGRVVYCQTDFWNE